MAKSTLEELLLKAGTLNESVEKRVDANQKSVIKNTMKEEVRKFIQEAVGEEEESDDSMDYDDTTDTGMDMGDASDDAAGETEYSDEAGDEESPIGDEADTEMPMGDVGMDDAGMDDSEFGGEEEVMDLTNATEEEVMQALKDLPDDATIEIVKKPSFNINITGGDEMGMDDMPMDDTGLDAGMDDAGMDDAGVSDAGVGFGEEDDEEDMDEMYEGKDTPYETSGVMNTSTGDKAKKPYATKGSEGINSKTSVGKKAETVVKNIMSETDVVEECSDEAVYEEVVTENKKLKAVYRKLVRENKKLKANESKAIDMIKESMAKMKAIVLTNSNLAYVTQLFTENSTSRKEKESILEKFDAAKTVGESEITFKMLQESLNKRPNRKVKIDKVAIVENENRGRGLVKEEVAYIDPQQKRMLELMDYKPKA